MVFAEAEANTVTDELAARSSLREREQEPQKIELLERDKEVAPSKTVILATTINEEEDLQFDEVDVDRSSSLLPLSMIVNYQRLKHLWMKCLLTKCKPRLLLRSE